MVRGVHELRPKGGETEKITINLGFVDLGHIDLMVQEGFYSNRTDFIRTAIRNRLDRYADVVKQSTARKSLDLGLRHYSREDLESGACGRADAQYPCIGSRQHCRGRHACLRRSTGGVKSLGMGPFGVAYRLAGAHRTPQDGRGVRKAPQRRGAPDRRQRPPPEAGEAFPGSGCFPRCFPMGVSGKRLGRMCRFPLRKSLVSHRHWPDRTTARPRCARP